MAEADDFEEGDVVAYEGNYRRREGLFLATIDSISYEGMEDGDPPDIRIKFQDGGERSTVPDKLSNALLSNIVHRTFTDDGCGFRERSCRFVL